MTQLVWNADGYRIFEAGVDHAVLYRRGIPGVAWNGIRSVNEAPQGGTSSPYYNDGTRYLNLRTQTEFAGTIEAFTYPDEFDACNGSAYLDWGISIDDQVREEFDLSYRTKIGNDQEGIDFGSKIHLVYNVSVAPSARKFSSISSNIDPTIFSWAFETVPIEIDGFMPTAHVTIDTRKLDPRYIRALENFLYGTPQRGAYLPHPEELIDYFKTLPDIYEILPNFVSGLSPIETRDFADLAPTATPGFYSIPENSRLTPTNREGLYTLDS